MKENERDKETQVGERELRSGEGDRQIEDRQTDRQTQMTMKRNKLIDAKRDMRGAKK